MLKEHVDGATRGADPSDTLRTRPCTKIHTEAMLIKMPEFTMSMGAISRSHVSEGSVEKSHCFLPVSLNNPKMSCVALFATWSMLTATKTLNGEKTCLRRRLLPVAYSRRR